MSIHAFTSAEGAGGCGGKALGVFCTGLRDIRVFNVLWWSCTTIVSISERLPCWGYEYIPFVMSPFARVQAARSRSPRLKAIPFAFCTSLEMFDDLIGLCDVGGEFEIEI